LQINIISFYVADICECTNLQNPSKPHFNHYLFEALCVAIRITCKDNKEAVTSFEGGLFAPFQEILQQDVQGMQH